MNVETNLKQKVAQWLNKVADELDSRFGHPNQTPRSQVQQIARELVDASDESDKETIKIMLNTEIKKAFRGTPMDH